MQSNTPCVVRSQRTGKKIYAGTYLQCRLYVQRYTRGKGQIVALVPVQVAVPQQKGNAPNLHTPTKQHGASVRQPGAGAGGARRKVPTAGFRKGYGPKGKRNRIKAVSEGV